MAKTFGQQMKAISKKYETRMLQLHKKVSLDLFKKVILKTPVDTGRARGNWMFGINTIPTDVSDDAKGNESLRNVITGLKGVKLGDTTVLANSVEYIGFLEYGGYPNPPKKGSWIKGTGKKSKRTGKYLKGGAGKWVIKSDGGYSKQAPQGMVRISIEEYLPTVTNAVAEVKRETR